MDYQEIQRQKFALGDQKRDLQAKLIALNQRMHGKGRYSKQDWDALQAEKAKIGRQILETDGELSKLKAMSVATHAERVPNDWQANGGHRPVESPKDSKRDMVVKLSALRDKYHALSVDRRITSSCRLMSAEFAQELTMIIRESINS